MRGVDFGLGIGYNAESGGPSPHNIQSRSAAVSSLKTGVMAQFKSSFVAASANSQGQGLNNSSGAYANKRPALTGFVSGGTIGGDVNRSQATSSFNPALSGVNTSGLKSVENTSQKNSERFSILFYATTRLYGKLFS